MKKTAVLFIAIIYQIVILPQKSLQPGCPKLFETARLFDILFRLIFLSESFMPEIVASSCL
jgi:hypothetical protein